MSRDDWMAVTDGAINPWCLRCFDISAEQKGIRYRLVATWPVAWWQWEDEGDDEMDQQVLRTEIPHVWDVDGRAVGVIHEMRLDGDTLVVRDVRTGDDLGQEVRLPFTQAVHVLLNLSPEEREAIEGGGPR